ncbi:MAG: hypothetical protein HQL21_03555 [Candidatus Omnitrophica bacterium]|nr:hypothetical protein [Candidatus Omnitrophota bacterium]
MFILILIKDSGLRMSSRVFFNALFFLFLLSCSGFAQNVPVAIDKGGIIDELELKGADISDALSLISQKSGINIIAGRNVEGTVSVFLKNVDAKEALRIVAEANGLAFADEGRIIRVMTEQDYMTKYGHAFGQERVTKVIKLNFVAAKDIVSLLSEMKSGDGKIIPNEEMKSILLVDSAEKVKAMETLIQEVDVQTVTSMLPLKYSRAEDVLEEVKGMVTQSLGGITCDSKENHLVVTDTLIKVEKIRKLVEILDARGRKVILQAKLVHVVLNEEHLNGVDWAGIVSDFQNLRLEGVYNFLNGGEKNNTLSLGTIADDEFSTLLEALDTVGFAREYPISDITISPDDQARLVVRFDEPHLVLNTVRTSDAPENFSPVRMGAASLEFFIKPVVDVDGAIKTTIMTHEGPQKGHITTLHSRAGNMVVLGGLIATEKVLTARKVPLMGDLPFLGLAFRYHNRSVRREEFVVFLTPKVVSFDEHVAPVVSVSEASSVTVSPEEKRLP